MTCPSDLCSCVSIDKHAALVVKPYGVPWEPAEGAEVVRFGGLFAGGLLAPDAAIAPFGAATCCSLRAARRGWPASISTRPLKASKW